MSGTYPVLICGLSRQVLQEESHTERMGGVCLGILVPNVNVIDYHLHHPTRYEMKYRERFTDTIITTPQIHMHTHAHTCTLAMTLEGKVKEMGDQYHQLLDFCCSARHCSSTFLSLEAFFACFLASSSSGVLCERGGGAKGEE